MSHPIRPSSITKKAPMPYRGIPVPPPRRDAPVPPQWPNFTGTSQFVGTSPSGKVTVYVDPTLGQPGLTNAQDLVNDADRVVTANDIGDSARVSALFEAELSECSMGGNLCGVSTGEALSRWCASVIGKNALSDFATGPQWYQDGMPDYVDQTDPTDQDADSTGNGMVFISWLMSQGYSLGTIAQTMVSFEEAGTLAQVYTTLTGDSPSNAWPNFSAAVNGLPNGVTNDDPFGGATQPAQLAHLAPWTVEMAGKVFATILTDIAAGKAPHQIVASVRAAMVTAPKAKVSIGAPAVCSTKSHQLGCTGQGDASASARQRSRRLN